MNSQMISKYRDPENCFFLFEGKSYRIASTNSSKALLRFLTLDLAEQLFSERKILRFSAIYGKPAERVLNAFAKVSSRELRSDLVVFEVESLEFISYPWEWADAALQSAAELTLNLRSVLLEYGFDLKDASAVNIQFIGVEPVLMDIGSIQNWRPNPSWNAMRQFVENFINPLVLSNAYGLSSADIWSMGWRKGVSSVTTRSMMKFRYRLSLRLFFLHTSTIPKDGSVTIEEKYREIGLNDRKLVLRATDNLTKRMSIALSTLSTRDHKSTWSNYASRNHYSASEIEKKRLFVEAFIDSNQTRYGYLLDVGGNDGVFMRSSIQNRDLKAIVLDFDPGSIDHLYRDLKLDSKLIRRVTPIYANIAFLSPNLGILGEEYKSFIERATISMALCHAIAHHLIISDGIPIDTVVSMIHSFNCPVQIEFAVENDPKVRSLIRSIPNWTGEYSQEKFIASLETHYELVEIIGYTTATRVMINCSGPKIRKDSVSN